MKSIFFCLGSLLILETGYSQTCALSFNGGWVRYISTAHMGGAYAEIFNKSDKPVSIKSIESSYFNIIESHETIMKNGMMHMQPYTVLVAPHETLSFEPHGKHFMLYDVKAPIDIGIKIKFEIKDSNECVEQAYFTVKEIN
jgi:copper(I)-binding protein